jgi:signal transduction histidine kinase
MMPFRNIRGWLLYVCAWIPYIASYYVIFRSQGHLNSLALSEALANVTPAVLLGALVFVLLPRIDWPWASLRFAILHTVLASLYTSLWLGLDLLGLAAVNGMTTHRWRFPHWGIYAVQWQAFAGVMFYVTLAGVFYMISAQRKAQYEQQRRLEAESLRIQAELGALRSQLNPHFLFNALHSVTSLVKCDPERAEKALLNLSSMLRYALSVDSESVGDETTLAQEMQFTEAYLALESLRLGDRLTVKTDISPSCFDCTLPALTLQPLVENAIKHSIAPRIEGGSIAIRASENEGTLYLSVTDNGDASPPDLSQAKGIGLRNIRRRLSLCYRGRASFDIQGGTSAGFTVSLALPQDDLQ